MSSYMVEDETTIECPFFSFNYEHVLFKQYQNVRQRNRIVHEYAEEFYQLSAQNNMEDNEHKLFACFFGVLWEVIQ